RRLHAGERELGAGPPPGAAQDGEGPHHRLAARGGYRLPGLVPGRGGRNPGGAGPEMNALRLNGLLAAGLVLLALLGLALGEVALGADGWRLALQPDTPQAQIVWEIRAPRVAAAAAVGAALGLAGAVMQGLLRNPLADPGVLGVSAGAGLGAALAISAGLAAAPGGVEAAALA